MLLLKRSGTSVLMMYYRIAGSRKKLIQLLREYEAALSAQGDEFAKEYYRLDSIY